MSSTIPSKRTTLGLETSSHTLLMSQIEQAHDDQGIMNLGKNCHFCNKLDFLPFHCEFCNGTFCSEHRTLDVHKCVGRPKKSPLGSSLSSGKSSRDSNEPTAASLFPDRSKHHKALDALMKSSSTKPKPNTTPLMKLTKFLHLQRIKRETEKKKSLFFSRKLLSATAEMLQIKKTAKGPSAVSESDRVHVWVLFVNRNEEDLGQIVVEKERRAVWVLKNWAVGRALDLIADTMGIINRNNATLKAEDRLNLFKVEKDAPVLLAASSKVGLAILAGATLYLVKGAM